MKWKKPVLSTVLLLGWDFANLAKYNFYNPNSVPQTGKIACLGIFNRDKTVMRINFEENCDGLCSRLCGVGCTTHFRFLSDKGEIKTKIFLLGSEKRVLFACFASKQNIKNLKRSELKMKQTSKVKQKCEGKRCEKTCMEAEAEAEDPDPDPWICSLALRIRLRIEILLFLSVTLKMPTKNKFFSSLFCLLLSVCTFTSIFKD
jgi:hypothetical protein